MHFSLVRLSTTFVTLLLSLPSAHIHVGAVPAPQTSSTPPPLGSVHLPAPTGPHVVGTTNLILTDHTRLETLSPSPNTTARTILAQIYYPTLPISKLENYRQTPYTLSRYATPGLARFLEAQYSIPSGALDGVLTNSYLDAPVSIPQGKPAGVVIFSSGYSMSRSFYATFHENLASLGYIVIAMEHLYDVTFVDIPGLGDFSNPYGDWRNTTETEFLAQVDEMAQVRLGDSLFILRSLADAKSELVKGVETLLAGSDVCKKSTGKQKSWWSKNAKVAMYGHSLGGKTTGGAMMINNTPTKILGGINLDGLAPNVTLLEAPNNVLKTPYLFWGTPVHGSETDPNLKSFFDDILTGWKRELALLNSAHGTFTDFPALVELFGIRKVLPDELVNESVGSIPGLRATEVMRKFVASFVDWVVRGDKSGKKLLDGVGKAKWPEVDYKR